MSELVDCPVCNGTGRMPTPDNIRQDGERYGWYGYSKEDDCCDCTNCGAQYMFSKPKGKVRKNKDGVACTHSYKSSAGRWRCTTDYVCEHCGDSYMIDSGD